MKLICTAVLGAGLLMSGSLFAAVTPQATDKIDSPAAQRNGNVNYASYAAPEGNGNVNYAALSTSEGAGQLAS
jgi:hypothetical protein